MISFPSRLAKRGGGRYNPGVSWDNLGDEVLAISPILRAGDLIGFSDPGPIGTAINLATWGIPGWGLSHVAILADHPDYDRPLLFESTTLDDQPCAILGRCIHGTQAHEVEGRVNKGLKRNICTNHTYHDMGELEEAARRYIRNLNKRHKRRDLT